MIDAGLGGVTMTASVSASLLAPADTAELSPAWPELTGGWPGQADSGGGETIRNVKYFLFQ